MQKHTPVGVFLCSASFLNVPSIVKQHPRWCLSCLAPFPCPQIHTEHKTTPMLVCFHVRCLSYALQGGVFPLITAYQFNYIKIKFIKNLLNPCHGSRAWVGCGCLKLDLYLYLPTYTQANPATYASVGLQTCDRP